MPVVGQQVALNDTRQIQIIRLVTQTTGPTSPTTSENHWSFFLLTSDGKSVRCNMTVFEYGNPIGKLEWEQQDYVMSFSAIRAWDSAVTSPIRVCDFASLLFALKRHDYRMSGGGSGCRWWCYKILYDLANFGYIDKNVPQNTWPDLNYLYHKTLPRKPLPMVYGYFLARLIPQPVIYQHGTVQGPNAQPRQDLMLLTIHNQNHWTRLEDWGEYEDENGQSGLCNEKFNVYYRPTGNYVYQVYS